MAARPKDLSEFSYGYALTEALIKAAPGSLKAAPYFPSLIEEGKKGGGYDVKLSFSGSLLYLQFKLSDQMERRSAKEVNKNSLIRRSFGTAKGLDEAYLSQNVIQRSCFFRPSRIGPLPDQKEHWVAFKPQSPVAYFCSAEPRKLDEFAMLNGRAFWQYLLDLTPKEITPDRLGVTASCMREIVLKELIYGPFRKTYRVEGYRAKSYVALREELFYRAAKPEEEKVAIFNEAEDIARSFERLEQNRGPPEQVAYLARTFFGCEVLRLERKQ